MWFTFLTPPVTKHIKACNPIRNCFFLTGEKYIISSWVTMVVLYQSPLTGDVLWVWLALCTVQPRDNWSLMTSSQYVHKVVWCDQTSRSVNQLLQRWSAAVSTVTPLLTLLQLLVTRSVTRSSPNYYYYYFYTLL